MLGLAAWITEVLERRRSPRPQPAVTGLRRDRAADLSAQLRQLRRELDEILRKLDAIITAAGTEDREG